jgi:hypothetical protein
MDEAYMSFAEILERLLKFGGEIEDAEQGVRMVIDSCSIDTPLELDVYRDEHGGLHIGSTPPLYYVDTSIRPSYHRLRFTAEITSEVEYGE